MEDKGCKKIIQDTDKKVNIYDKENNTMNIENIIDIHDLPLDPFDDDN